MSPVHVLLTGFVNSVPPDTVRTPRLVPSCRHLGRPPLPVPYLVDGAHACDGPDVVGDGDQRRSGQVLLADAVPLLFAHHVTKAVKKSGGELFNSLIDSRRAKNAAKP